MDTTAGPQVLSTPSAPNKGLNNTMKRKRAVVPKKTPNTNNPVRQKTVSTIHKSNKIFPDSLLVKED